ncbi:MAG: hypothetical protein EA379_11740 [Phycisphaerales bacterium]|nr:MAG: hypothetical protein EA379_11740 [Phycisphaerales bacterium]
MDIMHCLRAPVGCVGPKAQPSRGARRFRAVIAAGVAASCLSAGAYAGVMSDFTDNADGWVAKDGVAFWSPMPGAPGSGYLRAESAGDVDAKVMAPAKFVDNLSMYRNGDITLDARVFDQQFGDTPFSPGSGGVDYFVRLTIVGASVATLDIAAPRQITRAWVSLDATLRAADWGVSNETWASLLASATEFTVSIMSDDALPAYSVGFDNIQIVPAPAGAALALCALALGGPARRRRA